MITCMLPHDAMTDDSNSRFPSSLEFTSIHPTRFVLGEERGSNLGIIRYCPFSATLATGSAV